MAFRTVEFNLKAEPQRVVSNLARDESTLSQQHVPSTTPVEPPPPPTTTRVNLKYLLLSNYDKNFAARIGIRDFIPTQILSARGENDSDESDDNDGQDLEFIPFEKIDSRYPR